MSFFERQTHWVSEELEKVAARFNPDTPHEVELHGSPMFKGSSRWRRVPREVRVRAICDALRILADSHQQNRIFVVAVDKSRASPRNAVEIAFEQLASRFDQYLMRLHRARNTQRGLMIFDKSTQETTLQGLARDFKRIGHSFGQVRNLAEVPVFIDSRASRLVQLADLVAYAAYQHYEHHNDLFWDIIVGRLDATGGVVHGLYYHR